MAGKEGAPIETVVVGNNREYFSPIDPHVPDALRDEFVQSDIDEADMDIMWLGDDKIVLLPKPVDKAFVDDVSGIFKYKNTTVLTPDDKGLGLSRNTIKIQKHIKQLPIVLEPHLLLKSFHGDIPMNIKNLLIP